MVISRFFPGIERGRQCKKRTFFFETTHIHAHMHIYTPPHTGIHEHIHMHRHMHTGIHTHTEDEGERRAYMNW